MQIAMAIVLAAIAIGVLVAVIQSASGIVAVAIAMALLIAFGAGSLSSQSRKVESTGTESEGLLRPARWAFYLGLTLSSATLLRPAAGLTATDWLFAVAGLLALLHAMSRQRSQSDRTRVLLAIGASLLAIGGTISSISADSLGTSALVLARVVTVAIGLAWIASFVLNSEIQIRRAVLLWSASAAASGFAAVIAASTGFLFPGALSFYGRYSGLSVHFNELGAICAMTLVPAVYLVTDARNSKTSRVGAVSILVGVIAGILLSGSVNALLTAFVALTVWALLARVKFQTVMAVVLLPLVTVVVATALVPPGTQTPLARLDFEGTSTETAGGTVSSRLETFRLAQERIEENPIVGVGFADRLTDTGHEVHNILLELWYSGGILAMIGMLSILVAFGLRGWRSFRMSSTTGFSTTFAAAMLASFIAFVTYAMAAILLYKRFAWISPALMSSAFSAQLVAYSTSRHARRTSTPESRRGPTASDPLRPRIV